MVQGTAEEIIESQHLVAWEATGMDLPKLARELEGVDGISQVSAFGTALHVTGRDEAKLEAAIAPFRERDPGTHWERIAPGLEDVFINLMDRSDMRYPAPEKQ